ncbi:peptidoglycan recognition family protein [Nonomuraea sp. NPDC049141]|uniref:N-acetylmuramoyl-L-alanine amidase n=1 Tax=Nonomuraea sp. NPDC049141 TaxID=3155500 RepID=UPI0033E05EC8
MMMKKLLVAGVLIVGAQQAALAGAAQATAAPLPAAFDKAASTYEVPRDLLVALGYAETHLDDHDGQPSAMNGFGVMHLVSNPSSHTLEDAAKITSLTAAKLKTDDASNVLGGAAVLRAKADKLGLTATERKDPAKWYEAVAAYGGAANETTARVYADAVYEVLAAGVNTAGVKAAAKVVDPDRGKYNSDPRTLAATTDYPGALWAAASSSNYAVSNRPTDEKIDRIIIHVTQGSYAGTISWFQNSAAKVSAHYVVRSSDGQITQMVREKNRAFHAGVSSYNHRSIGIEHEGFINDASWFTDQMYRSSAALTKNIADRYGIPKDRSHIIGHVEVPGSDHTDPGSHWDWTKYMSYVGGGSGGGGTNPYTAEKVCGDGYKVIDSQALGTAGTVYLLYNSANANNCVATLKKTSLGKASATSAFLQVAGKAKVTDSGSFTYYAGPVRAAAEDKCVTWGGSVGSSSYTSPPEHCG